MMSHDEPLLDALRSMWDAADPSPPDLATRALFRLALEDLDVEVMALQAELSGAGARGPELASTIIFESQSLALTIMISAAGRSRRRLDGWITPSAALVVRLHAAGGILEETADDDGRFAFADVAEGVVHLTVEPTGGAALHLARQVATPPITI